MRHRTLVGVATSRSRCRVHSGWFVRRHRARAGHATSESISTDRNLRETFDRFDTDGSGLIGRDELKKAMKLLDPKITDEEIADMLGESDEDANGGIGFDEFRKVTK